MTLWLTSIAQILVVAHTAIMSVTGVVTDGESGEPLAGAVVSLTDLDRSAVTDSTGRYAFYDVPAGPQHATVRRIGYSERTLHVLVPRAGPVEVDIALEPRPIAMEAIEVEVRPAVPVRGLDEDETTTFPDRGLSIAAVRAHPLSAEPDVFAALGGGEVVLRPESPAGLNVRGGATDQITYVIDGIPVFSPYHVAGTFSAWNPDALSRLELLGASPPPGLPESLSGAVSAFTRAPGAELRTQGAFSTTQARVTVDGPLGSGGAGYLFSLRTGFPGVPDPEPEPSYLRGENGDWLAKLESPLFSGRARLLVYDSASEIDAAAVAELDETGETGDAARRHSFEWHSRSVGGEWARDLGASTLRLRAWSAVADAEAVWIADGDAAREDLASERRDEGVAAAVETRSDRGATTFGLRAHRSRTSYSVAPRNGGDPSLDLNGRTPVTAAFVEHARSVAPSTDLKLGLIGSLATGDLHLSPRAQLQWRPSAVVTVSAAAARLHQFAQSLRNAESMVGNIFPADLYVGAATPGVPVARSDQAILALGYRPVAGVRVGLQAYARDFGGLVLVAPVAGDPFARSDFVEGSGVARGVAVEAAANGARYAFVASYGLQRVRLDPGGGTYVPEHGMTHSLDTGVIVFPSATSSVRLGVTGLFGRRTTALDGPLEWEACNLIDQGCEFGGSPTHGSDLGATDLPAYLRIDFGVAKHWHFQLGNRDGAVSLFGTVTNVVGRRNVLAIATDPVTGELTEVGMRPRSPLVIGLDWRF